MEAAGTTNARIHMTPDFSEFPEISKEAWLQQIARDLKDKRLEDLSWKVTDELEVNPFGHADDFPVPPAPLTATAKNWEICEDIHAADPVAANRTALDALEGGVQGLCFHLDMSVDSSAFKQLMQGIYPDFIGLHFAGPLVDQNPGRLFPYLSQLAEAGGVKTSQLHGSIAYDPALHHEMPDWRYLTDLMQFSTEQFPQFKVVSVASEQGDAPVSDVVSLLRRGNFYMEKLCGRGGSPERVASLLTFDISIGKSYFYEIAKIRAFKLLWLHILKAWQAPLTLPAVAVHFRAEVYTDDLYTNMIRATTMAMSAILGGADRLTVLPYDAGREGMATYSPAFGRRIARNVQHLLQLESGFGQTADPAAGSYYIENLTQQLAAAAWKKFTANDE